jgi:cyclopropane fatty-acyl-phospholipid synthase-like methyltransferase
MPSVRTENINDRFFDGYYKDVWRALIPEALTKAEVDYLVNEGRLKAGSKVLDLMCGYGRHALSLGRRGVNVTAVDTLVDYISEIKEIIERENLPIAAIRDDVIQFQSDDK